ncbi:hypothetical protein PR048_023991 [Dryococelus australis]|uniref:Uncharacterized protein n=1 Tax=Dryococelus australis TaxID=614101 RepID=A0ABQ9GVQ0_9NEOP|nr:hypothetical protein PR048_023991 [Dryococelus australis]
MPEGTQNYEGAHNNLRGCPRFIASEEADIVTAFRREVAHIDGSHQADGVILAICRRPGASKECEERLAFARCLCRAIRIVNSGYSASTPSDAITGWISSRRREWNRHIDRTQGDKIIRIVSDERPREVLKDRQRRGMGFSLVPLEWRRSKKRRIFAKVVNDAQREQSPRMDASWGAYQNRFRGAYPRTGVVARPGGNLIAGNDRHIWAGKVIVESSQMRSNAPMGAVGRRACVLSPCAKGRRGWEKLHTASISTPGNLKLPPPPPPINKLPLTASCGRACYPRVILLRQKSAQLCRLIGIGCSRGLSEPGFDFQPGRFEDFRMRESWRTMPLVSGGSSRGSPVSPAPFHSGSSPYAPRFTPIGSQDLDLMVEACPLEVAELTPRAARAGIKYTAAPDCATSQFNFSPQKPIQIHPEYFRHLLDQDAGSNVTKRHGFRRRAHLPKLVSKLVVDCAALPSTNHRNISPLHTSRQAFLLLHPRRQKSRPILRRGNRPNRRLGTRSLPHFLSRDAEIGQTAGWGRALYPISSLATRRSAKPQLGDALSTPFPLSRRGDRPNRSLGTRSLPHFLSRDAEIGQTAGWGRALYPISSLATRRSAKPQVGDALSTPFPLSRRGDRPNSSLGTRSLPHFLSRDVDTRTRRSWAQGRDSDGRALHEVKDARGPFQLPSRGHSSTRGNYSDAVITSSDRDDARRLWRRPGQDPRLPRNHAEVNFCSSRIAVKKNTINHLKQSRDETLESAQSTMHGLQDDRAGIKVGNDAFYSTVKRGGYGAAPEYKGRGEREIPEKNHPVTIPTYERSPAGNRFRDDANALVTQEIGFDCVGDTAVAYDDRIIKRLSIDTSFIKIGAIGAMPEWSIRNVTHRVKIITLHLLRRRRSLTADRDGITLRTAEFGGSKFRSEVREEYKFVEHRLRRKQRESGQSEPKKLSESFYTIPAPQFHATWLTIRPHNRRDSSAVWGGRIKLSPTLSGQSTSGARRGWKLCLVAGRHLAVARTSRSAHIVFLVGLVSKGPGITGVEGRSFMRRVPHPLSTFAAQCVRVCTD